MGQDEVRGPTNPDQNIADELTQSHVSVAARMPEPMPMMLRATDADHPERAGIIRQTLPPSPTHRPNGPRALFSRDKSLAALADAEVARQPQLPPTLRHAAEMSMPSLVAECVGRLCVTFQCLTRQWPLERHLQKGTRISPTRFMKCHAFWLSSSAITMNQMQVFKFSS